MAAADRDRDHRLVALVLPFNIYGCTVSTNSPNYIDDPNAMWTRAAMQVLFAWWYGTRSFPHLGGAKSLQGA